MNELLTSAQMRAIERAAIDSGSVTGLELMERAGAEVVKAILAECPAPDPRRTTVFCGPGNNGGDGFVVARLLQQDGWQVEVFFLGDPSRLPPDARISHDRWLEVGRITPHDARAPDFSGQRGLVIDAVFGTGLSRPLTGEARAFVLAMERAGVDLSIDIPSGFCADSGRFLCVIDPGQDQGGDPSPPDPDLIVTFQRPKVGHMVDQLSRGCATLKVVDIGIEAFVPFRKRKPGGPGDPAIVGLTSAATARRVWDKAGLRSLHGEARNKFSHGHALVLAGGEGRGGAARLAARGALRVGAGLVTIACPPAALAENAARLDAVMLRTVGDGAELTEMLQDPRISTLCLGPGLGTEAVKGELLKAALDAGRATVLDADALTLISRSPALFAALHPACVLTPHGGEFTRLFPDIAAQLLAPAQSGPAYSKVDATREAAARAGCTVLFKGPDTVIAEPSGRAEVNGAIRERAAPWLATAGSGDVLAGLIVGLMARNYRPFDAACAAAWLHVEAARSFGPGLIAEDLPEELPAVFRKLLS